MTMGCPVVTTGSRFLVETLDHLDCQAQTLGSFGFQALAAPGSPASLTLTGLLTLFVALFGIRLLFGGDVAPRDAVGATLKVGIVLTLALSWPAFRILAYDTVLKGPAEVAASITPGSLPDSRANFAERLQNIDSGMAALTVAGSGRQTGSLALDTHPDDAFRSVAMSDETALGWGRSLFLASVIGSLALVRIGGGLLLALAPLFAGLLLFDLTRGLFAGWLRGLVLVALGSLGLTILLSLQLALLEPWLSDALNRRNLGYATPSAPTELFAVNLGFALATVGLIYLLGKVAFQNDWFRPAAARERDERAAASPVRSTMATSSATRITSQSRAVALSDSVASSMRREQHTVDQARMLRAMQTADGRGALTEVTHVQANAVARLGSGYRRAAPRATRSQVRRDTRR